MAFRLTHLPALDGFRVLAIAPVLVLHSGAPFMRGGHIGVDLFFTLSGFLITSLLLRDGIRFKYFWTRRALRLAPPLIVVVAVVMILQMASSHDAIAAVFYVTNWTRITGWTGDGALSHTWSLAIEEQYYIIWPLLLWVMLRWNRNRFPYRVAYLTAYLAGAIYVWSLYLYHHGVSNTRLYNGLDARADSILIGSALALFLATDLYSRINVRVVRILAIPAMLVLTVIATTVRVHSPFMYELGYFLVPLCVAVLLTSIVTGEEWWFRKFLALPAMAWTGRISYGIYLWHVPVYRLMAEHGFRGRYQLTLGTLVTVGLSALSYYTVERVARRKKRHLSSARPQASASFQPS